MALTYYIVMTKTSAVVLISSMKLTSKSPNQYLWKKNKPWIQNTSIHYRHDRWLWHFIYIVIDIGIRNWQKKCHWQCHRQWHWQQQNQHILNVNFEVHVGLKHLLILVYDLIWAFDKNTEHAIFNSILIFCKLYSLSV